MIRHMNGGDNKIPPDGPKPEKYVQDITPPGAENSRRKTIIINEKSSLRQDYYLNNKQPPIYLRSKLPEPVEAWSTKSYLRLNKIGLKFDSSNVGLDCGFLSHTEYVELGRAITRGDGAERGIALTILGFIASARQSSDCEFFRLGIDLLNKEMDSFLTKPVKPVFATAREIDEIEDIRPYSLSPRPIDKLTHIIHRTILNMQSRETLTDEDVSKRYTLMADGIRVVALTAYSHMLNRLVRYEHKDDWTYDVIINGIRILDKAKDIGDTPEIQIIAAKQMEELKGVMKQNHITMPEEERSPEPPTSTPSPTALSSYTTGGAIIIQFPGTTPTPMKPL